MIFLPAAMCSAARRRVSSFVTRSSSEYGTTVQFGPKDSSGSANTNGVSACCSFPVLDATAIRMVPENHGGQPTVVAAAFVFTLTFSVTVRLLSIVLRLAARQTIVFASPRGGYV